MFFQENPYICAVKTFDAYEGTDSAVEADDMPA